MRTQIFTRIQMYSKFFFQSTLWSYIITFNTINTEIKTGDDFVDFHEYNSNVAINDSYTKAYVPCIVKVGTITYDFKVRTERYVAPTE
jgi:hypothetical protein